MMCIAACVGLLHTAGVIASFPLPHFPPSEPFSLLLTQMLGLDMKKGGGFGEMTDSSLQARMGGKKGYFYDLKR